MEPDVVFLAYQSRSGSTYLCARLDEHPRVVVTPEARLPDTLVGERAARGRLGGRRELERYVGFLLDDYKFASWGVGGDELVGEVTAAAGSSAVPTCEVLKAALRLYAGRHGGARRVVLKEGRRALAAPGAARAAYPGCRFLHLVRDPRAVYASQRRARRSRFPLLPMSAAPAATAREWRREVEAAEALAGEADFHALRFEDLVRDAEGRMTELFAWLGLAPAPVGEPRMTYAERIPPEQRHLHRNLAAEPDPRRLEAWRSRLPPADEATIAAVAGDAMRRLGYDPPADLPPTSALRRGVDALRQAALGVAVRAANLVALLRRPGGLGRRAAARRHGW